jgi:hypothetical protein
MAAKRNFDSLITSPFIFWMEEIGSSKKVEGRRFNNSSITKPLIFSFETLLKGDDSIFPL